MNSRTIKWDVLPDGKVVSTVNMFGGDLRGIDTRLLGYAFETMVFPDAECFRDLDCQRYWEKPEALKGHEEMVAKWSPRH